MMAAKSLKFFNLIIWIPQIQPSMVEDIKNQLNSFTQYFGQQSFLFCPNVQNASEIVQHFQNKKILIICSSVILDKVYSIFKNFGNVYAQYIIFCGSQGRAIFMETQHPYHEAVYHAYYDQFNLVVGFKDLEEILLNNPALMNQRIHINPPNGTHMQQINYQANIFPIAQFGNMNVHE